MSEYIIRICSFILILYFECSLVCGIAMLVGLVFKNLLDSVAVAITLFFIDWYGQILTDRIGILYTLVSPMRLYFYAFGSSDGRILLTDTTVPYVSWLNYASPYVILMLVEILAVLAINCFVSIKMEE